MRPSRLDATQITAALRDLPAWQLVGASEGAGSDALRQTFQFADFNAAFGFMSRVAMMAERLDHHPDWSNVYDRVVVTLSTHDVGGVAELDVRLARFCDAAAAAANTP